MKNPEEEKEGYSGEVTNAGGGRGSVCYGPSAEKL